MRIAVLVNLFPSLSETFILNQITGLLDRGHTVDIYANRVGETEQVHADVTSYRLSERTRYMREVPGSPLRRYFTALQTLGIHMFTNPRACVWALLHGHQGRSKYSLNLLYIVRPFLPQRSYDVIHCHFGPMGVRGALLKDLGLTRGKMVTTFYGHDVSRYPLTFGRDIYQQLSTFLPVVMTMWVTFFLSSARG